MTKPAESGLFVAVQAVIAVVAHFAFGASWSALGVVGAISLAAFVMIV